MNAPVVPLVHVERFVEIIHAHDGAGVVSAIGQDADDIELQVDALVIDAGQFEALADFLVERHQLVLAQ